MFNMAEAVSSKRICLVVLIGLPGSGKTTFCRQFQTFIKGQPNLSSFGVVNVCYDQLIPISKQKDIALLATVDSDTKSLESNCEVDQNWKSCRKNIVNSVDQLIDKLKSNATENGDNSPDGGIDVRTILPDSF